jgi:hypothetical protein
LFCKECGRLRKFKIFSQEKYDKNYGKSEIPPNKPLFCKCEACENFVIYTTDEFAELQENANSGLCKIWGTANLEADDMVFHPENGVCIVDAVDRVYDSLPRLTLKNEEGKKIEIQAENLPDENAGHSPGTLYRLFPQDAENSRIGDPFYNTETGVAGKVIGLEFNGGQRIIIEFKSGEIEKYHCENNRNYLTDEILEQNAKWRCRDFDFFPNLQISSKSKILSVNCLVPDFKSACELDKTISSIPQVRCFIMHTDVEKTDIRRSDIYMELLKNCINICSCQIEFRNQEVYIAGFYSAKDIQKQIYRALAKFPIKKINLGIKLRPEIKTVKTINESERFVRISKLGKDFHIDGWVRSRREKKRTKLKSFFSTLSLRIENHLLVIKE